MSSNLLKEVRNKKIILLYGYPGNDSYEKAALNAKKALNNKEMAPSNTIHIMLLRKAFLADLARSR